jgi:hypothetical protein
MLRQTGTQRVLIERRIMKTKTKKKTTAMMRVVSWVLTTPRPTIWMMEMMRANRKMTTGMRTRAGELTRWGIQAGKRYHPGSKRC